MLFEKNENKQKEAWVGPFKKKTKNFFKFHIELLAPKRQ